MFGSVCVCFALLVCLFCCFVLCFLFFLICIVCSCFLYNALHSLKNIFFVEAKKFSVLRSLRHLVLNSACKYSSFPVDRASVLQALL